MKRYYRVMLGQKSVYAADCLKEGYIGAGFDINQDLAHSLPDEWREFNREFIPVYLKLHPEKSKIAAGLSCGFLWTVAKGIKNGDIILSPDGTGQYRVGEVTGDYYFVPGTSMMHRRPVHWLEVAIARDAMSDALQKSTGSIGTVSEITKYEAEIQKLTGGLAAPKIFSRDPEIDNASAFAMEKHLEDFLVHNWHATELGKEYDVYVEEGEVVGQQYQTDTGPIDILAVSKDETRLLVVELKKGRASDVVVGQTLRYMGYVQEELADNGQKVVGVIIALDDDQRIRRALAVVPAIQFYRYQVSFKLVCAQ